MNKTVKLQIKSNFVNQFRSGYPLINKEAIKNINALKEEGAILDLFDENNHFLAKGYYGIQNKGRG